jgi:hypothetical protein
LNLSRRYGYGGKFAVHFASAHFSQLKASVVCYPSHVTFDDITMIREPVSFVCAEHDHVFDKTTRYVPQPPLCTFTTPPPLTSHNVSHIFRESAQQFLETEIQSNKPDGRLRDNFAAGVEVTSAQLPRESVVLPANFEAQFVVYPGTVNGFALRPDLKNAETRAAFDGALGQACAFLTKHLGVN